MGNILWGTTGTPVCTLQMGYETYPQITGDGLGGAICTWFGSPWHSGFYNQIYIQRVYADGTPGGVEGEPTENAKCKVQKIKLWPNPFYALANIQYSLDKTQPVSLNIYNITGQRVKTLVKAKQKPGSYNIQWNGKSDQGVDLASGIYILCLKAGNINQTQKITYLK